MSPDHDYRFFEEIVKRESGLVMTAERAYLWETRLLPVAYRHGLGSLSELALRLKAANDADLLREVVEAMASPETSFFRDRDVFGWLAETGLPRLFPAREGARLLRIWSAGCASGQEAYSLAILLREMGPALEGWTVELLATDLSQELVDYAREGLYTQNEVQRGLSARRLLKYFTQEDQKWRARPEVRQMIGFSARNLLAGPPAGAFGVILCRNVLDCFDAPTRKGVLQSLKSALKEDGFLVLGAGEDAEGVFAPAGVPGVFTHG